MKINKIFALLFLLMVVSCDSYVKNETVSKSEYLKDLKAELKKEWPKNRTINLVFHGHSVPAGYFKTPVVNTFSAYPYLLLKELKERYPYAVINIINTAIGSENSLSGANRFETQVLSHRPDVLFIDYALNDRGLGLDTSAQAWELMIRKALELHFKVILLTPSPDQRINIAEPGNELEQHTNQIKKLAEKYGIGLVDSYAIFQKMALSGDTIANFMSQVNHPNEKGHQLITNEILSYFQ